ncbi:hypothetical protein HMPREF0380_01191 [Eubacterium infirmum F0142]|nr:hypothetical protein HMPREF0380_01191 [Eubacterium infirmum F0142]
MYKDELLALWNGINWKETVGGIYFTSHKLAKEVQFSFTGYKEENLSDIKDSLMIKLSTELETLDNFALQIIKEKLDDKTKKFELTDVMFDISGCYGAFALGYYAGESPAGELYLLVKFDNELNADRDLIYEVF